MSLVKLIAVGDVTMQTNDNKHPFGNIKQLLKSKDILFGNLETVLSTPEKGAKKAVLLCSPPEMVKYLKDVSFDILSVANNHTLDMGMEGFENTLDTLSKNKIAFIGAKGRKSAGDYAILQRKGIKFRFLGYTTGYRLERSIPQNRAKESKILADIETLKSKCDFVIVSLHWGIENVFYPSPKQIDLAHKLIDHGAILILGHHPHVIQGIEEYKNGLIAYSLGNFQFNPRVSQSKTSNSIILSVNFNKDRLVEYDVIPIVIDENLLPCIVEDQEKDKLLKFASEISQRITNGGVTKKWWFEEIAKEYLSGNLSSCAKRIKKYGIRSLLECCLWLITPFCIECYMAIIREIWKKCFGQVQR
jgi:poly-gamma-glutamate capsule biosynthesis protein CapA/YwtB (metallophosphatase superfamily)